MDYSQIVSTFADKNIFIEINGNNFMLIWSDNAYNFTFETNKSVRIVSAEPKNFETELIVGIMNKKAIGNSDDFFVELSNTLPNLKSYCIGCWEKLSINSSVYSTCGNIICSYKLEEHILDNDVTDFIRGNFEVFKLLLETTKYTAKSVKAFEMLDPFPNHFLKSEYKAELIKKSRGNLAKLQLEKKDYEAYSAAKDMGKIIGILDNLDPEKLKSDVIDQYPTDKLMAQILGKDTYLLIRFIIKSCCLEIGKDMETSTSTLKFFKLSHPFYVEKEWEEKLKTNTYCYLFHGSSIECWYSILRNGIKVLSNTKMQVNGAAYGPGIYTSDSYQMSLGYSNRNTRSNDFQIVGVYEVLGDKAQYVKANSVYVIPSHTQCILRYLIVGTPKNLPTNVFKHTVPTNVFNQNLKTIESELKSEGKKSEAEQITEYFDKKLVQINQTTVSKMKIVGNKKLLVEYKKISSNSTYKVTLNPSNTNEWNVTWSGVTLTIKFPDLYPFEPPFVFISSPRFNTNATNITKSGAVCCEYLTKSNWLPVISIESLIIQIFSLIVEPNLSHTIPNTQYTESEAVNSYEKLAKGNGWM